jgi:hypothetical protein
LYCFTRKGFICNKDYIIIIIIINCLSILAVKKFEEEEKNITQAYKQYNTKVLF